MSYRWDEHIDIPRCICPECGKETYATWEDCSFAYEYGSISAVHHDGQWVSECCEAVVEEVY